MPKVVKTGTHEWNGKTFGEVEVEGGINIRFVNDATIIQEYRALGWNGYKHWGGRRKLLYSTLTPCT